MEYIKIFIELIKTTWGGSIFFLLLGGLLGGFVAYNDDLIINEDGLQIGNYNSPDRLARYLRNITGDEKETLRDKGYYDIELLAKIHNDELKGQDCATHPDHSEEDCGYYASAKRLYYQEQDQTGISGHYHLKDGNLSQGIHQELEREDETTIALIKLFKQREKPFADTEFKVAFSEELGFNEARVCQDNHFWASRELKIRSTNSINDRDANITLSSIQATEDCQHGGQDACLIEDNNSEYSPLNNQNGESIQNKHFIKISLEAAKELYPNKFDSDGNPIKACELGFIHREE